MYNDQPPNGKNAPKAKAHSKGNNEFLEFENINLIFLMLSYDLFNIRFYIKKKNTSIDDFFENNRSISFWQKYWILDDIEYTSVSG